MGKIVGLTVLCVVLGFQCLSLAKAIPIWEVQSLPPFGPPICPGDPPAIPDSPFIENIASKYQYLLMLTGAYYSKPESCNWNAKVDLNYDSVVDIYDAIIVAEIH